MRAVRRLIGRPDFRRTGALNTRVGACGTKPLRSADGSTIATPGTPGPLRAAPKAGGVGSAVTTIRARRGKAKSWEIMFLLLIATRGVTLVAPCGTDR